MGIRVGDSNGGGAIFTFRPNGEFRTRNLCSNWVFSGQLIPLLGG